MCVHDVVKRGEKVYEAYVRCRAWCRWSVSVKCCAWYKWGVNAVRCVCVCVWEREVLCVVHDECNISEVSELVRCMNYWVCLWYVCVSVISNKVCEWGGSYECCVHERDARVWL